MFPPFKLLNDETEEQRNKLFRQILDTFPAFIGQQEKIRLYVASTPGYGHQSSSISLLRRLAGAPEGLWRGFDYRGVVEIIYDNLDDHGDSTLAKIHSLLPELNGQNHGDLDHATLRIIEISEHPLPDRVNMAFCGGYDTINEKLTREWNVQFALILQPYNYDVGFFAPDLAPGNVLKVRTPTNDEININLDSGNLRPFKLQSRAYFVPVKDLDAQDWNYFTSAAFPDPVKNKVRAIQYFTSPAQTDRVALTPVYGINFPGATAFAKPVRYRIFLEMAMIRQAIEGAQVAMKAPVVINFGSYTPGDDLAENYANINRLLNKGLTLSEQAAKLLSIIPGGPENESIWLRKSIQAGFRKTSIDFPGAESQYLFVDLLNDGITPEELIEWVTARPKRVLFVQLGFVPPLVFNYVLSKAGNPSLFEGPNTAVVAINTGKPYLNTNRPNENKILYPTGFLGEQNAVLPVMQLQGIADKIEANIDNWPADRDKAPTKILGDFVDNIRNPDNPYNTYFGSIKEYYSLPAEESNYNFNEKFNVGLSLVVAVMSRQLVPKQEVAEEPLLETLYNNLLAAAQSGSINLLDDIFKKGNIHDYYIALLSGFRKGLIVTDPIVNKITDPDNTIIEVTLSGDTDAFLISASVDFSFTDYAEEVFSVGKFTGTLPWNLNDIPWIVFESPFILIRVADANLPSSSAIGGSVKSTDFELLMDFPIVDDRIVVHGEFDELKTIGDFFSIVGGIDIEALLPSPVRVIGGIGVKSIEFAYNNRSRVIDYISVVIQSSKPWEFFNGLNLSDIGVTITVLNPVDIQNRKTQGTFSGNLKFNNAPDADAIALGGTVPDLSLRGQLASPDLPINQVISVFWPDLQPNWPGGQEPKISELSFFYQFSTNAYSVDIGMVLNWPIHVPGIEKPVLEINSVGMSLDGTSQSPTGSLSGSLTILPESEKIGLMTIATYLGSDVGWMFSAKQTSGKVSLLKLFTAYLPEGWQPDEKIRDTFDIEIDGLELSIETKTSSWKFSGKTATPVTIPGTGIEINLNLTMGYNGGTTRFGGRETLIGDADTLVLDRWGRVVPMSTLIIDPPEQGYVGTLSAHITWENIKIIVFYDFNPNFKSFGIRWGIIEGKIISNGETTASLTFAQSTSVGSIIETMVSWATGSKFGLSSPWSILNSIPLNNLSLNYNFTKKQVSLDVGIGPIEMGFAKIESIELSYKANEVTGKKEVIIELKGQFRWQDNPSKPLGWDATKPETAPAPEGQGNKYLDLRLLALGQHVTLPCFADANTVQEAITCMKKLPVPDENNISIPPVVLDANSSWLIGMDFGVLRFGGEGKQNNGGDPYGNGAEGTALISVEESNAAASGYFITMQIIFNDPNLYALRIKLDGDAAKVLKGLDFQILYKKISDSIGLYKAEITLPDAMRFIRMGQYNITLPVFGIEYYTNGDFQVDIGFPWKENFSRSLTFQTLIWTPVGIPIPVMGSLGVYFGRLSSATTNRVPPIDNGTFNPVLVFGFGIQFGLGYTFEMGILRAGFSLTAVAILEGIVAKFNAYQITDGSAQQDQIESSYYFWLQGTVGIIGKLFGTIDFAIIKARVDIDIRLLASFTFVPYEPIILNLRASVDAEVSVKISLGLFSIRISFSFSAKISQSVTIKAIDGSPPWHISNEQTAFFLLQRRKRKRGLPNRKMLQALAAFTAPNWSNLLGVDSPHSLKGYITLGLTMAGDMASKLSEQQPCYVAMMFIDSVAPPQEDRTGGIEKAFGATPDTAFEALAKMILRWAVAAIQPHPMTPAEVDEVVIKDVSLQGLLNLLNNQDNPTPISGADANTFMGRQFKFSVEGPTTEKEPNATYFPVAPEMTLSLPKYGNDDTLSYTFGGYNKTSVNYLKFLRIYFNELAVKVEQQDDGAVANFALNDSDGGSLGDFIFGDYFLMVCRQMLQVALDSLREFKYFIQDNQTPEDIIKWINDNADLTGDIIYDLDELFSDNAEVALTDKKELAIQGANYVVQAGDTFDTIAANSVFKNGSVAGFDGAALATLNADADNTLTTGIQIKYPGKETHITQPGQSLKTVAAKIGVNVADLIANSDITKLADLPLPVATFKVPKFTTKTTSGDTLRSIAAKFRIDLSKLAIVSENAKVSNLFDKAVTPTLDIANLNQFKVKELLREIQATQGLQHLSGMTSRYYMAGLRLPTDGITPEKKGMWVTGDKPDEYKLPDFAGLYALTGQQFAIPVLNDKDDYNVDFANGNLDWLTFVNDDPSTLCISIKPNSDDTKQIGAVKDFATANKLDAGLSFLGLRGMFNTKAATYTFNNEIHWNAASAFSMPYGGLPPGVPSLQLWQLPNPLMSLPDLSTRKINPRIAMKVGQYNEAVKAMVDRELHYYGYASVIEFTVKKVPEVSASPATATTYEVMGADGSSANVLERIVSEIGADNNSIQTLILAYQANPNSTTANGIQTDAANALVMGLAQVNLSTVTRPESGLSAQWLLAESRDEGQTLLNEKADFVRLLWEASITRAGGYFLYYFNKDSGAGLPDRIFSDKSEATLSLIVVYSQPSDEKQKNTVTSYMNALVTGEEIDRKNAVLFAEANPLKDFNILSSSMQNLSNIAYDYFGNVSQVAADNIDLKLRGGTQLLVSEGTYEVGPGTPGGVLATIAEFFGTTAEAIKQANPKITSWPDPLPDYTVLYLPRLTVTVGSSKGGDTLGAITKYYGINLTAFANNNQKVNGIFADGESLKISGGPVITAATVPPGNVAVEAIRPKPPEIPDSPSADDYGEIFLLNVYSLLSSQVFGNAYFEKSKLGLPASPTTESENDGNPSKVGVPKTVAEGEDWCFRQAVPYNVFSKQILQIEDNFPDPNDSPYKGIGDLLQVDFAWQDLYGNRLITQLSNPGLNREKFSDDPPVTILNKPPILTGYSDPIIGLNQWPSVASTYAVVVENDKPTLNLALTFDASVYQGLMVAEAKNTTVINTIFTENLDKVSAETVGNYTLDNGIKIQSATLGSDKRTVTLAVSTIPDDVELVLSIADINNAGKTQSFQGLAKFFHPASAGSPTSSLLEKAKGDLQTYTQLWYQLTDPFGIDYTVATSLLTEALSLDDSQIMGLVKTWLASIWQFVNDRANTGVSVPLPAAIYPLSFTLDIAKLNPRETYQLDLKFIIERTGGAVMGDLETTGGIREASSVVSPYAGAAGETAAGLTTFVENLESTLTKEGVYALKVASGIDRSVGLANSGGNDLWIVRLGLDQQTSLSYQIEDAGDPMMFAPRPISTVLENRTQVPIWDFNPQTGIDFDSDPSRHLDFTGIDMDLWSQQFFSKVDETLSPEFTAAIQLVDNNKNASYLQTMLDNKTDLAGIIKDWMTFVFSDESGSMVDIREAFRQQLLVKLSNAYAVKAGMQYRAKVQAGTFLLHFVGVDPNDGNDLTLLFTSDIDKDTAENIANYIVSGDLKVTAASLDPNNPQRVALTLSGTPVVEQTQVSIVENYKDVNGTVISGDQPVVVAPGAAATPELYGNVTQNFRFLGAALDGNDNTLIYLYFSGVLDKETAEKVDNYTVSNLQVNTATLEGAKVVKLKLSGEAALDQTTVTIVASFTDTSKQTLIPPLVRTVQADVDISHQTQGISITAGKLNLKNSPNVPLPLLVSAPQLVRGDSGAVLPYIDLDISYEGSAIEHQIGNLPNIAEYRASSWLNFFDKPSTIDADLGSTKIPMILRSFPTPPSMVNQLGKASYKISNSDIGKILSWDYIIKYSQTVHYPQDELYVTVNFNVYDSGNDFASFTDAFNQLAEFITIYPEVEKVFLETLIKIDGTTSEQSKFDKAAVALESFNNIVGRIVTAAEGNGMIMADVKPMRLSAEVDPYIFQLKEGIGTVGIEAAALIVTIKGKPPSGIGDPLVSIPGYTTKVYSGICTGDFCFYFEDKQGNPLKASIGQDIGPREIMLPKMNILERQDAEITVELKRNIDLVPGKSTTSDFIYSTGKIGFANLYHPLINYSKELPIAKIGSGTPHNATLSQHLENLFTVLLQENSQDNLSFLMTNTYTYSPNPDLDGIELPVIMQPLQSFDVRGTGTTEKLPTKISTDKTLAEMVESWGGSILKWFGDHKTSIQGGVLNFDLTIYSNLTQQPKPLLRLTSLTLEVKYISDLEKF